MIQQVDWRITYWYNRLIGELHIDTAGWLENYILIQQVDWRITYWYNRLIGELHIDTTGWLENYILIQQVDWRITYWYSRLIEELHIDWRIFIGVISLFNIEFFHQYVCMHNFYILKGNSFFACLLHYEHLHIIMADWSHHFKGLGLDYPKIFP